MQKNDKKLTSNDINYQKFYKLQDTEYIISKLTILIFGITLGIVIYVPVSFSAIKTMSGNLTQRAVESANEIPKMAIIFYLAVVVLLNICQWHLNKKMTSLKEYLRLIEVAKSRILRDNPEAIDLVLDYVQGSVANFISRTCNKKWQVSLDSMDKIN